MWLEPKRNLRPKMSDDKARQLNSAKWALINEINNRVKILEVAANFDATAAARKPLDEGLRRIATASVMRLDNTNHAVEKIIELIHKYWPKQ